MAGSMASKAVSSILSGVMVSSVAGNLAALVAVAAGMDKDKYKEEVNDAVIRTADAWIPIILSGVVGSGTGGDVLVRHAASVVATVPTHKKGCLAANNPCSCHLDVFEDGTKRRYKLAVKAMNDTGMDAIVRRTTGALIYTISMIGLFAVMHSDEEVSIAEFTRRLAEADDTGAIHGILSSIAAAAGLMHHTVGVPRMSVNGVRVLDVVMDKLLKPSLLLLDGDTDTENINQLRRYMARDVLIVADAMEDVEPAIAASWRLAAVRKIGVPGFIRSTILSHLGDEHVLVTENGDKMHHALDAGTKTVH